MATIISDKGEGEIDSTLTPEFFDRVTRRVVRDIDEQLSRIILRHRYTGTSQISGHEAAGLLKGCIGWLEAHVTTKVSGYSALRWLWMLRRIPGHVFAGTLATVFGYDYALAEIVSAKSAAKESRIRLLNGEVSYYSTAGATIRRLAELCVLAQYLSQFHSYLRWAGKGSVFHVGPAAPPVPTPDRDLREAVELYDRRVVASSQPLERSGTVLGYSTREVKGKAVILRVDPIQPKLNPIPQAFLPDWIPETQRKGEFATYHRFAPTLVSLEPLLRLAKIAGGIAWPREVLPLALLLWSAFAAVLRHRTGILSLITRGYLMLSPGFVENFLEPVVVERPSFLKELCPFSPPLTTGADLLEELRSIDGTIWPLRSGPIIRSEGQSTCLDLRAATARLDAAMEFPATEGPLANARAKHFELVTQDVIDRSAWQPNAELKQLRGRTLRVAGASVTDIDAIGEKGDQLLLVSCKSIVYSADYDAGDYRIVRNSSTTISEAVKDWENKTRRLYSVRRGDNFDFSKFSTVISIVCTPTVVYVPIGQATKEVRSNLRAASSLGELANWLGVKFGWLD